MREKKSPFGVKLPSLNSLRAFEAAARHNSFVQAAEELHVTHGAVSRQVKQLEEQLGVELFERRNRGVHLTRQGAALAQSCHKALQSLAAAVHKVKQTSGSIRPLVLSCEPTIAMRWLIPRLPRLRERYPECDIHLLAAGGKVNFGRDQIDIALRRNDFDIGHHWQVESVGPEMMGPVCAPSLAEQLAFLSNNGTAIRELKTRTRPDALEQWEALSGEVLNLQGEELFEHFYLSLQAAGAGLGIAMGSAYMVEDELQNGRLIAPFGFTADRSGYVLISPIPFREDKRRLILLDWMRYEMAVSRQAVELPA